jgi:hypothetical protein
MLVAATRRGPDNLSELAQLLESVEAEIVPFDADQARTAQVVYVRYGKVLRQIFPGLKRVEVLVWSGTERSVDGGRDARTGVRRGSRTLTADGTVTFRAK